MVDKEDRVIGSALLGDCLAKGLLHRAVAVIIIRNDGSILLQRRSEKDLWNPGMWTLSCTGHVRKGETYASAASRELSEELGLSSPIRESWKVMLPPIRDRLLTEHEWVSIFTTRTEARVTPDPVELSGTKEVRRPELERLVDGGPLTEDARILLKEFLKRNSELHPPIP